MEWENEMTACFLYLRRNPCIPLSFSEFVSYKTITKDANNEFNEQPTRWSWTWRRGNKLDELLNYSGDVPSTHTRYTQHNSQHTCAHRHMAQPTPAHYTESDENDQQVSNVTNVFSNISRFAVFQSSWSFFPVSSLTNPCEITDKCSTEKGNW